jgi:LysM repeat protein
LVILSTVLVALVLLLASAVNAADTPTSFDAYRVSPGDTVWIIAEDITPDGGDIRDTVSKIKRINRLDGSVIRPGQMLEVPASP